MILQLFVSLTQLGIHPGYSSLVDGRTANHFVGHLPSLDQTEGVPDLVVEVAPLFTESLIEEDIVAGRCREHHAHAHTIGTILVNQLQGIGTVAQRLGHLASQLVANDTCEIDVLEGVLTHIFLTSHNHAGHPEEDDIGACHQVAGGIIVLNFLVVGIVDTVEERNGPEP